MGEGSRERVENHPGERATTSGWIDAIQKNHRAAELCRASRCHPSLVGRRLRLGTPGSLEPKSRVQTIEQQIDRPASGQEAGGVGLYLLGNDRPGG